MDERVLLLAVAVAVLAIGMGGGGDSEPTKVIEIPDSDDGDWQMWDIMPLKKQKKVLEVDSGFEYSVRDRLQKLNDQTIKIAGNGNEVALQLKHNVALLDNKLREANANAKLSEDGKSLTNYAFVFERQTNQLTDIGTACARAMAEAERVLGRGSEWNRELLRIRNENYENRGPDASRINQEIQQISDNRDGVLRNFVGMQQAINDSIERFAKARTMEYERLREQYDQEQSDRYEADRVARAKKKFDAIAQEQERRDQEKLLREKAKIHGLGNKRGGDSQESQDTLDSDDTIINFKQGAKRVDTSWGDLDPDFNQSQSGNAQSSEVKPPEFKPQEVDLAKQAQLLANANKKLHLLFEDEGLKRKYASIAPERRLRQFLLEQLRFDIDDQADVKKKTGEPKKYFQKKYDDLVENFKQWEEHRVNLAAKRADLTKKILSRIYRINPEHAIHLKTFAAWYNKTDLSNDHPLKSLAKDSNTSIKEFEEAFNKRKNFRQREPPPNPNELPRIPNFQTAPQVKIQAKAKQFTTLLEDLKQMQDRFGVVNKEYGAGANIKQFLTSKEDAGVRKMVTEIDGFQNKYKDQLSKQALKGNPNAQADLVTLRNRWKALLGVPWTIKVMGTKIQKGEKHPTTDRSWFKPIQAFSNFENNWESPEFTTDIPKAETVRLYYEAQFPKYRVKSNGKFMIQITILYMIRRKLEQIRLNAFGDVAKVATIGDRAKANVKFPDQVGKSAYVTQLTRQQTELTTQEKVKRRRPNKPEEEEDKDMMAEDKDEM